MYEKNAILSFKIESNRLKKGNHWLQYVKTIIEFNNFSSV